MMNGQHSGANASAASEDGPDRNATAELFTQQTLPGRSRTAGYKEEGRDALTTTHGRGVLFEKVEQCLQRSAECRSGYALLVIEIRDFQRIIDNLGQKAANEVLVEVGSRLIATVGQTLGSAVARLRNSEFAFLMGNSESEEDALTLAQLLQFLLSKPITCKSQQVCIRANIGIAFAVSGSYSTASALLADAAFATHRARSLRTEQCAVYKKQMREEDLSRIRLASDLGDALRKNQFELYYQPQVNLHTGEVSGLEALIRWIHPKRGFVSPMAFIPLAEESGLMIEIGRWVAITAIQQLAAWQLRGVLGSETTMAINVSARQFHDQGFLEFLKEEMLLLGVPSGCLVLEITESLFVEDFPGTTETMQSIALSGIGLDLDDFGTGYSSLSYLHQLPFRSIKIDQSFVRRMSTEHQSQQLVTAIVSLASALGMGVIAEGVETDEQLKKLLEMHCATAQGYLFSRPLPAHQIEEFLLKKPNLVCSAADVLAAA